MKILKFSLIALMTISVACKNTSEKDNATAKVPQKEWEVQGHRGERAHYPENSIPGYLAAIKKGVDVIELDVVISGDRKVVVSHEPFMSSLYVLTPSGDTIPKKEQRKYNFYKMPYDSIRKFDIGSKGNKFFPEQKKMKTYKPLLSEVIDSVEAYVKKNDLKPVKYNIELKSGKAQYGKTQPRPKPFIAMVMKIVKEKGIEDHMDIQSFDAQVLNVTHEKFPDAEIGYLVSSKGIKENLGKLQFTPNIYSPNYKLVSSREFVDSIHQLDMRLIPWTVNDSLAIKKMDSLGVDGVITDFPERALKFK